MSSSIKAIFWSGQEAAEAAAKSYAGLINSTPLIIYARARARTIVDKLESAHEAQLHAQAEPL